MNTQTHTQTEAVILEMLTENTGRSFLDSGDAYGRAWERNQALGVEGLKLSPAVTFSGGSPRISTFHFLAEHLTFAPALDAAWQTFDEARPDESWRENMAEFLEYMGLVNEGGVYEKNNFYEINTYENEYSLLSQVLQFHGFNLNGRSFIALQIHGGADIRGGYTKPRIFEFDFEAFWCAMESARVSCGNCLVAYSWQCDQIELDTDEAENAETVEALDEAGKLKEWFWNYETENTCPNCGVSGTIAGA